MSTHMESREGEASHANRLGNAAKKVLLADQRRLKKQLAPLGYRLYATVSRRALSDFSTLMEEAKPTKVQRLVVRRPE